MCLAQGPQRSDASEARTRGPSTLPLSHCAPCVHIHVYIMLESNKTVLISLCRLVFSFAVCMQQILDFSQAEAHLICSHVQFKVKKNAKIRNQYNQVPHLTRDTIWESDKNARNHHAQGSQGHILSQQVITRLHSIRKTNKKHK